MKTNCQLAFKWRFRGKNTETRRLTVACDVFVCCPISHPWGLFLLNSNISSWKRMINFEIDKEKNPLRAWHDLKSAIYIRSLRDQFAGKFMSLRRLLRCKNWARWIFPRFLALLFHSASRCGSRYTAVVWLFTTVRELLILKNETLKVKMTTEAPRLAPKEL